MITTRSTVRLIWPVVWAGASITAMLSSVCCRWPVDIANEIPRHSGLRLAVPQRHGQQNTPIPPGQPISAVRLIICACWPVYALLAASGVMRMWTFDGDGKGTTKRKKN